MQAWDYVVVGGGSAGCVVAARLSEHPANRVLLLEAGEDWRGVQAPKALRCPELATELMRPSPVHAKWQWPDITARRTLVQAPRAYLQGAGLGGSSIINGLVALRPPPSDFDRWAQSGCPGWSGADVLRSFVRLEDDEMFGDAPYHGRGGPVPIRRVSRDGWGPLDLAFVDAANAAGYSWNADLNAPDSSGVGFLPANVRDGERVTANDSYLEPARARANLSILGKCLVERVLFDDRRDTVGVTYRSGGERRRVDCGQVILCAGSIHTPAILMRSGVGPADDLRTLGVDVIVNAPVGQTLQDHPMFGVVFDSNSLSVPARGRGYSVALRTSSGIDGGAENDILIHPTFNESSSSRTVALFVFLYYCHSRGVLRLASPDPGAAPRIEEGLLSAESDRARMRVAVRRAIELADRTELKTLAGRWVLGGSGNTFDEADGDAALDAVLLSQATDAKHISCTCPMGRPGDEGVVVDPEGRVAGVSGLRIADLSVTPWAPRANTYLTAVMIGERMAAMIQRSSDI